MMAKYPRRGVLAIDDPLLVPVDALALLCIPCGRTREVAGNGKNTRSAKIRCRATQAMSAALSAAHKVLRQAVRPEKLTHGVRQFGKREESRANGRQRGTRHL